ncbi:hypothetical protein F5X99DRAFT_432545 [Biscogniauxia marginata]|nr:hypothetical protein F5X99DRAFT_432545 [Biscogniauxia marginata]
MSSDHDRRGDDGGDDNGDGSGDNFDSMSIASDHNDDDGDDRSVSAGIMDNDNSRDSEDSDPNPAESPEEVQQERDRLKEAFNSQKKVIRGLEDEAKAQGRQIRNLSREVDNLSDEVDRLKNGNPAPEHWYVVLRDWLNNDQPGKTWEDIYRECCKQENMSMRIGLTHPDLRITSKNPEEPEKLEAPGGDNPGAQNRVLTPFQFEKLPPEIQGRIFRHMLVKDTLIHCISRLDPFEPPRDFPPENAPGMNLLLHRFHFKGPCYIPEATEPNTLLSPLLVSKRWYYIGVHIFYGANTFAFSSLGELGLFFKGIGQSRVERTVNIELMWHGNLQPRVKRLMERSPPPKENSEETSKVSRRTVPLTWFMKTKRMRTVVVHISECAKSRMRRKYEMQEDKHYYQDFADESSFAEQDLDVFQRMVRRTDNQPNYRKYRSMRTVHGMDYLYQLRGLKWIRFYEANSRRELIRDWSFIKDLSSVVTLPKPPQLSFQSQLENLSCLTALQNWKPSESDFHLIERFYDDTPVGEYNNPIGGSETSPSASTISDTGSSGNSNDDDSSPPPISGSSHPNSGFPSPVGGSLSLYRVAEARTGEDEEMPDANSTGDSRSLQHSSSSGSDEDQNPPPGYTQQTSIPSQAGYIDLTVDDGDGNAPSDQSVSGGPASVGDSSSGLFVTEGSISAGSTTRGPRTVTSSTGSSNVIDLTLTDSEDEYDEGRDEPEEVKDEGEDEHEEDTSGKRPRDPMSGSESGGPDPKRPRIILTLKSRGILPRIPETDS